MNIFGFDIGGNKDFPVIPDNRINLNIADQGQTIRPELKGISIPDNKQPANILPVKPNVLSYNGVRGRRGEFLQSEYDLGEIGRVEDTDSYVHQAFLKKIGLLFKEGYEFVGANPRTIQYVKLRLEQIARATGTPTDELVRSIGAGLIKKSNAFLVKVRKTSASGGQLRKLPGKEKDLQPVAGYFVAPPETMEVDADKFGRIRRWKQRMHSGEFKYFAPEDVIHFYFNKKEGLMFGTPVLVPVIDDIRALRKIEENIELLIYQHLFPLFHYKIGTDDQPATINEVGQSEIEVAKREIQYMPSEGGIVTSHRHNIELIGTENRALRAETYLEHFKKRVFSGLGISAVDMGEGECYDESTQTLTENGWKFHWAIDHTKEKIATYNPIDKRIEFHIANYKYEAPYVGKMVKFKNKHVDMMVTPSHDMWALGNKNLMWEKMTAQELIDGGVGGRAEFLETAPYWETNEDLNLPHEDTMSLAALGGFIASFGEGPKDRDVICIGTRRTVGFNVICDTLSVLDIPWTIEGSGKEKKLCIDANTFDGFFKKFLSIDGLQWSQKLPLKERKLFVRRYVQGSFKTCKARSNNPNNEYITPVTEQLAVDIIQQLVMSAGYSVYVNERHDDVYGHHFRLRVNLREKNRHTRSLFPKRDIEVVDYSGIIYCYNVPNHLFVTRRGNRVTIQGNTANRATSDNMSRNLVDSVKDIQRTIECQVNDFMVNELLLESTFGSDVLSQENKVKMKFKEIDLEHQIKKENHYTDLFTKNAISLHEAREGMGRQPFPLPTSKEVETMDNLDEMFPGWHATFFKLIDEPKALIQAIDEPYTPAAKAAAKSRSTSVTETDRQEAGKEKEESEQRSAKAAQSAAPAKTKDFLSSKYSDLESDLLEMTKKDRIDLFLFRQLAFSTRDAMVKDLKSRAMVAFINGFKSFNANGEQQIEASIRSRGKIETRINVYVTRLMNDTISAVDRQGIANLPKDDRIHRVKAVFDSFRFRNRFMEDVEIRKAYNLGFLEAAKNLGFTKWKIVTPSDACTACKNASIEPQSLQVSLSLEDIPPLHANARAQVEVIEEEQDLI